ncbi:MAG: hypothetical protein KBD01_07105 [Acidobacteria bacterium]|nr:hypothetical protein [Acidobacteriota bacterium]
MDASLRALLAGIIDYAGLFPPASLALDPAIRQYAAHRAEPESWMLARFVCPVARLAELDPYREPLFAAGAPLAVCALGRASADRGAFLDALAADLREIRAFLDRWDGRALVPVYEVRAPDDLRGDEQRAGEAAGRALELVRSAALDLDLFIEVPLPAFGAVGAAAAAAHGLARAGAGFKLRTGGTERAAFPSAAQVAAALIACRDAGARFKATAGLHHPLPRHDDATGATMHGFLNVFGGAALAHAGGIRADELGRILSAADPGLFRFEGGELRCGSWRASAAEIATARRELALAFGSCSFDEPRDDLRALGLF